MKLSFCRFQDISPNLATEEVSAAFEEVRLLAECPGSNQSNQSWSGRSMRSRRVPLNASKTFKDRLHRAPGLLKGS